MGYPKSTSFDANFNAVFGDRLLMLIFNIHGQKLRFSASSQNSSSEKSIFGHFENNFLKVWFFPGSGCLFPVSQFTGEQFNGNLSSLAGLNKKLFNFLQKYQFWPFLIM